MPRRAEREGGLFDALFGGGFATSRAMLPAKVFPDAPRPRKVVAAPKVTGPSYYNYKADPLVRVDFAALARRCRKRSRSSRRPPGSRSAMPRPASTASTCSPRRTSRKAISDYYAANPQFIWVTGQSVNAKAEAGDPPARLGRQLRADRRPTMPSPFRPRPPMAAMRAARMTELVRFEMTLSARVLRYVRDAQSGRIDPNRISGYHDFPAKTFDA